MASLALPLRGGKSSLPRQFERTPAASGTLGSGAGYATRANGVTSRTDPVGPMHAELHQASPRAPPPSTAAGTREESTERGIFHRLSLIASRWVGLGADGLSSSCYGPEEAYRASASTRIWPVHGVAVVVTCSSSPPATCRSSNSSRAVVATWCLASALAHGRRGERSALSSIMLDHRISIASGVEALLSFTAHADSSDKVPLASWPFWRWCAELARVKESIRILTPIFLLFVITHAILIVGTIARHAGALPAVTQHAWRNARQYQSIVSGDAARLPARLQSGRRHVHRNRSHLQRLARLREPRVRTGSRPCATWRSRCPHASGILIGYQLSTWCRSRAHVNATLLHRFTSEWDPDSSQHFRRLGTALGRRAPLRRGANRLRRRPRTLAFMAVDRWVPNRFSNLSSRLSLPTASPHGAAAAAAVIYTGADVSHSW